MPDEHPASQTYISFGSPDPDQQPDHSDSELGNTNSNYFHYNYSKSAGRLNP
jgi:hypothetical protein